ncbi:MAG: MG2 domain-containing protein [Defluviitaleaceae bacterium]|nr:MG2 domain-containing protein [Defluviitaleaceae bacterium]
MGKKRSNIGLYILAAIIILVSGRYVQVRISSFVSARREQRQVTVEYDRRHELQITTNWSYFTGTELIAAVQVRDMYGQPVMADLHVSLSENGTPLYGATAFTTDDSGHSIINLPLDNAWGGWWHNLHIRVESELGHENFQKEVFISVEAGESFIINFDKGLYNPGDDVLFRILAIGSTCARPIAGDMFTISIFDGNDNRVFLENVIASDFGIMSGRFRLADEVNSGFYRLVVEQHGMVKAYTFFEVSPFVLPRFGVTLETDNLEYSVGETIYLSGSVMYFFGEPVNQGIANIYVNGSLISDGILLDDEGEFSFSYQTQSPGRYTIMVEVIDSSNFRVEASISVQASVGVFEVDLMPEFGYFVHGFPNTVYVFTHTIGGAPIQANVQVSGHGFSRIIQTDNNGIGSFILEDMQQGHTNIDVHAIDMDGNSVQTSFSFPVHSRNITLSTNRPRYAMGETIYLQLNSLGEGGMFKIYAYRNDRLLQIITSENNQIELNLNDVFGLIDIYAVWIAPGGSLETSSARRTIFIDPGRYMQLSIQSDSPEYLPGAFVNLGFGVTDNTGHPLDAALLVSIVDEAMLNLAANDLSIDNVRLALEDIRFGDDLDAATLYASLIAGASEQAITRLLLRQSSDMHLINTTTLRNPVYQDWYWDYWPHNNDIGQAFRNFLRILVIIVFTIIFFVKLSDKEVITPSELEARGYLPNESVDIGVLDERLNQMKRYRAAWLVAIALILFVISLIFLSSCSSGRDDAADEAPTQDIPWAGDAQPMPEAEADMDDDWSGLDTSGHTPELAPPPTGDAPTTELQQEEESAPLAEPEIETQTARVRRLFLETMLFIPELIARDGRADLQFILADNITTWNIQVVGNTQDGLVGHAVCSIRAFQPFFVDFELPRNSIRGDQISIPVTVFNYTEVEQTVILTIAEMDWFELQGSPTQTLVVESNRSQMVYVPITITRFGNFVFRAYADTHGFADAMERGIRINPEGFRIRRVVSSENIEASIRQQLNFAQPNIPDTRSAIITFYPSVMSTVLEGMENIFRMPFGCFEQTSSILYPNILALRYMQMNNLDDPALTQRALSYINSGYQRLLTFEVERGGGGFSLFGCAPAETLLTAYGLMQLKDLTTVYSIDERVLDRMLEFLFDHQNSDGTYEITGWWWDIPDCQRLAFNAYITWAISEAFPRDWRLDRSVEYLVSQLNVVDDYYTLALIANVLVNTQHYMARDVVNRLADSAVITGDAAYITSTTRDYFGAFGRIQYLQATGLTSLALSRHGSHEALNNRLINYIVSQRDSWGTWHSTQATILSLKALTQHVAAGPLQDGRITITIGNEVQFIDIASDNTMDFYQVVFTGLEEENIIEIDFPNLGRMVYKVVQEFFAPYDAVELDRGFYVTSRMNTEFAVHELVEQEIRIVNTSGDIVNNGLIAVSIPQGFRVERGSLARLRHMGIIERYEMRFDNINLYLRDTMAGEVIDIVVAYRPAFPVDVIGGHVRVFDYYNPMVEGYLMPRRIIVR